MDDILIRMRDPRNITEAPLGTAVPTRSPSSVARSLLIYWWEAAGHGHVRAGRALSICPGPSPCADGEAGAWSHTARYRPELRLEVEFRGDATGCLMPQAGEAIFSPRSILLSHRPTLWGGGGLWTQSPLLRATWDPERVWCPSGFSPCRSCPAPAD